jgi:hypothetical protein
MVIDLTRFHDVMVIVLTSMEACENYNHYILHHGIL